MPEPFPAYAPVGTPPTVPDATMLLAQGLLRGSLKSSVSNAATLVHPEAGRSAAAAADSESTTENKYAAGVVDGGGNAARATSSSSLLLKGLPSDRT